MALSSKLKQIVDSRLSVVALEVHTGFVLALATSGAARAGSLPCDPTPDPVTGAPLCGWSISVNDVQLATGSFVIDEATGRMTVAVSRDGLSVSVFGACTDTDL